MHMNSTTPRTPQRRPGRRARQNSTPLENLSPAQEDTPAGNAIPGMPPIHTPSPQAVVPQAQPPRRAVAVVVAPPESAMDAAFAALPAFVAEGHRLSEEDDGATVPATEQSPSPMGRPLTAEESGELAGLYASGMSSACRSALSWRNPSWWRKAEELYARISGGRRWLGGVPSFNAGTPSMAGAEVVVTMESTGAEVWRMWVESPMSRPEASSDGDGTGNDGGDAGMEGDAAGVEEGAATEPEEGSGSEAATGSDLAAGVSGDANGDDASNDAINNTGEDNANGTGDDNASGDATSGDGSVVFPEGRVWGVSFSGVSLTVPSLTVPWPGAGAIELVSGKVVPEDLYGLSLGVFFGRDFVSLDGASVSGEVLSLEGDWHVMGHTDYPDEAGGLCVECDAVTGRWRITALLPELPDSPSSSSEEETYCLRWRVAWSSDEWYGRPLWTPWSEGCVFRRNRMPGRVSRIELVWG